MDLGDNKLHPFGHGGDIGTAAQCAGVAADELLDFSANINPLGPPAGLLDFLASALSQIDAYPDPACRSLLEAIKKRYQPQGSIFAGNGAGELIYLLMRALPAGELLLPAPTFTLYARAAEAAERKVTYHHLQKENGFVPNIARLCDEISSKRPAVTILCNPNNPTGVYLSRQDVLQVANACEAIGGYLVVDEAFLEFLPDWQQHTLLHTVAENIIVLCSLTKMYAIPGLRLGFMSAPAQIVAAANGLRDPWSVNQLAQVAGQYVLQDQSFVERSAQEVRRFAADLARGLKELPDFVVYPPSANYIFIESKLKSAQELQRRLLGHKILVRDCGNYQGLGQKFLRVAVRTPEENQALLAALHAVMS